MRLTLALGTLALTCSISAHALAEPGPARVEAAARMEAAPHMLGRPFDAGFEPLVGMTGKNIFNGAKVRRHKDIGELRAQWVYIENSSELAANVRGWGIISIGGAASREQRYATYRALQVSEVVELDDTTAAMSDPPQAAVYYLSKIYYGRMYELVFSGHKKDFSVDVRAGLLKFGGEFQARAKQHNLNVKVHARGLRPLGEVLLDASHEKLSEIYGTEKNWGKPRPILVEFRRIPGRQDPGFTELAWERPVEPDIERIVVEVIANNKHWTPTGVRVNKGDTIVVVAEGQARLGGWSDQHVTPDSPGNGALMMAIGGTHIITRSRFVRIIEGAGGEVQFKLKDSQYSDNIGIYLIGLMIVRERAAIPCRHSPNNSQEIRTHLPGCS